MDDFLESLHTIYATTPDSKRDLRDIAVNHARNSVGKLRANDASGILFREVCLQVPKFAFALLDDYINSPFRGRCYHYGPHQPVEALQKRCMTCKRGGAH